MADSQYQRLIIATTPGQLNYKPRILRTLPLLSVFVITAALIGLIQYAILRLPHGSSTTYYSAASSNAVKRSVHLIPRQTTSEATLQSLDAAATSIANTEDSVPADTTPTTTGSATSSSPSVTTVSSLTDDFVLFDPAQTNTATTSSVLTIPAYATPSDYVTDTTQTIGVAQSTAQGDYVTDTTQTLVLAESAAPDDYVQTEATQTLSMNTANYVPEATTQTVPTTSQTPFLTTISSAMVIDVPVSNAAPSISSSTGTMVYTSTSGSLTFLGTSTTVTAVSVTAPSVSRSTSYAEVVQTVTPNGQSANDASITTYTSVAGGSTSVYTSGSSTFTSVSGGSTIVSVKAASPTGGAASLTDNAPGKPITLEHRWSPEQTFLGTYLAVLIAVGYRMIWTVLYSNLNLIEPFRQLSDRNGAPAERVFFSFYQSQSNLLGPLPAIWKQRWALALTGTAYLAASFMPALGSEAVYVDTDWGCPFPMASKNPCQARMTADVMVLRVLQGLLAFAAVAILLLISFLLLTKTGLPANPSSIATVASLMRHPALLDDLNEIPADATTAQMKQAMVGRRYKMAAYKTMNGETGYGIVPTDDTALHNQHHAHGYAPVAGSSKALGHHRIRFMDCVLAIVVLGAFGVVLAYYLDGNDDAFNTFFSSNTFGPNFILTGAATIVATLWKSVETSAVLMAPYVRLYRNPTGPRSTILFRPHNTPVLSTLATVWNRYYLVATVTCVTLGAEALGIVLSGVPYATGQTWLQFIVSSYMSLAILGLMIIVIAMVIIARRFEPQLPRNPDTLGAVMSYLSGSRMLDDYQGTDWQDEEVRDRRLRLVGKRYSLAERARRDGKHAWIVDETY